MGERILKLFPGPGPSLSDEDGRIQVRTHGGRQPVLASANSSSGGGSDEPGLYRGLDDAAKSIEECLRELQRPFRTETTEMCLKILTFFLSQIRNRHRRSELSRAALLAEEQLEGINKFVTTGPSRVRCSSRRERNGPPFGPTLTRQWAALSACASVIRSLAQGAAEDWAKQALDKVEG